MVGLLDFPHVDYQFFPAEYFSGSDISIYFGDIWIDEVVTLETTLVEAVQPVFGFMSYVYDAVMRGSRQVSGSFTIPFRETNFLRRVLDTELYRREQQQLSPVAREHLALRTPGRDTVRETEADRFIESIATAGVDEIRRLSREYEERAWQADRRASAQRNSPWFQPSDPDGFTIVIVAGDPLLAEDEQTLAPHAVSKITGVQIMSQSRMLDPSGEPILEQYTFIAKDIDGGAFQRR